ncbi:competence/damage-inducible protein A [Roseospira marina]|uniref:Competence/damage-inducible protein A n=1 Tax=Roseospira marina TaxID=140057 RepID=A0A5M6I6S3_9PROT|nr:molybdopterin-binding protein [Roseospira marina]KAA5603954.1 competence/damage-inducible protein A [Roseospira marina]MBB4315921.1 molybdenum cofactor synthesis domain-containing protein [Roseospira marina]MBB5089117.1 molybdenum cofactor synthesis domain-containing protein [Roseospira marina]
MADEECAPSTAALVLIGNEILSGRTQDTNGPYLAQRLGALGILLREIRVVPDVESDIIAAVLALRARFTYVFTTGGIGPTHDDITAASIAAAFDVPVVRHPEAVRRLRAHYGEDLTEARLKMAEVPEGASLIDNPVSAAPGFRIANVFVLAGVPKIMQAMVESVAPDLTGGPPILSRAVSAAAREGEIAGPLAAIQTRWPAVDLGSYPWAQGGLVGTTLVARGTDPAVLEAVLTDLCAMFDDLGLDATILDGVR